MKSYQEWKLAGCSVTFSTVHCIFSVTVIGHCLERCAKTFGPSVEPVSFYFIFLHEIDEDTESAVKTGQKNRGQWRNSSLSFAI